MYDLVVVGHLTIDVTIVEGQERVGIGGPPAYAMAAPALGLGRVAMVAAVSDDFPQEYRQQLAEAGLDLSGLKNSKVTTRFVNRYLDGGYRTQRATSVADPIKPADIPQAMWRTRWMHLSPVLQEVDPNIILEAHRRHVQVSVDVQGFVRRRTEDGQVEPCPWEAFPDVAPHIHVLKADVEEIRHLTGQPTPQWAARAAIHAGCRIVLVTDGPRGSYIHTGREFHPIPALPPRHTMDHTGCGDVYAVGFLAEYMRTGLPLWSAYFAASCASFNVETPGPTGFPTHEQVTSRLKEFLTQPQNRHHLQRLEREKGRLSHHPKWDGG